FFSYDWEFIPQFEGALLFNNDLIKSLGMQNPYEMQSKGEWTWGNFKEELIKATQKIDEVQITGLQIGAIDRTAQTAIMSNGVKTVEEKDGKFVVGYDSPEAFAALDYLKDLIKTKVAKVSGTTTEFSKDLKSVYYACESWIGTVNADGQPDLPSMLLDDYGFMPFPHGPNGSDETVSAYVHIGRRLNFVVGVSDNDPEDIGTVINYVFEPLEDSEPEAWKKLAKNSVFHHTEGYDNFVYMTENANYDYSAELFDVRSQISTALNKATSASGSAVSAIDAIKELVQVEIDEAMNNQN
ncbi:MAG: transporter substrate-binding protein, partial [Clostridia bacterium]|nr:transporter substrate-binding protein [Clostridia bacterium]